MKKVVLFILFTVSTLYVKCQLSQLYTGTESTVGSFRDEFYSFSRMILSEEKDSNFVFVIYGYPSDEDSNLTTYTVGYITERHNYRKMNKAYCISDFQIYLVVFDENVKEKVVPEFNIYPINDSISRVVTNKLNPKLGLNEGARLGFVYRQKGNKRTKEFIDMYSIEFQKSIYQFFPEGLYYDRMEVEPFR